VKDIDAARAFAICERLAQDRGLATGATDFADGYRRAAEDIARAIRAACDGCPPTPLERDLRDAEIEARTLARVAAVAAAVVADLAPDARVAEGVRKLLGAFFAASDLPQSLRPRVPSQSTTTLVTGRLENV
jgi:hypothetical protein